MKTTFQGLILMCAMAGFVWTGDLIGQGAGGTNPTTAKQEESANGEARVEAMVRTMGGSIRAEMAHMQRQTGIGVEAAQRTSRSNATAIARLNADLRDCRVNMIRRVDSTDGRVRAIEGRVAQLKPRDSASKTWVSAGLAFVLAMALCVAMAYLGPWRKECASLIGGMIRGKLAGKKECSVVTPPKTPSGAAAAVAGQPTGGVAGNIAADTRSLPTGSSQAQVRATDSILDALVKRTSCWSEFRMRVTRCSPFFRVGIATDQGRVREENQDTILSFGMGAVQAVLVADGMGGCDNGKRSSSLGVAAAANYIVERLLNGKARPEDIVRDAIYAACRALGREAEDRKLAGLRTTMLVVLATTEYYCWAAIGDTVGAVVRRNGGIDRFFAVQRLDSGPQNVLTASLGPDMSGNVLSGSIPAEPLGDCIICATDGVHDRVPAHFERTLADGILIGGEDPQETVDRVLKHMADARDKAGFVCDDNLSLGLLVSCIGGRNS